jgi:hypothetical protein
MLEYLHTLRDLYPHLDNLLELDIDSDTLFASGYLRGFISLSATVFGDENQLISTGLIDAITDKLTQARAELSPQDNVIVQNFWLVLQGLMLNDAI